MGMNMRHSITQNSYVDPIRMGEVLDDSHRGLNIRDELSRFTWIQLTEVFLMVTEFYNASPRKTTVIIDTPVRNAEFCHRVEKAKRTGRTRFDY